MEKILITGGSGFIGSHVVKDCLRAGYDVRVLHLPGDPLTNLCGLDLDYVAGDVRDSQFVARAVDGCQLVIHLAAMYALWERRPGEIWSVNVEGTRTVLQAALDADVRRVVHTSSIAVFGGQGLAHQATEESRFALGSTSDLYSWSKYAAHQVAQSYLAKGLDLVIVAPTGPVGAGDIGPTPTGRLILMALNAPILVGINTSSNMAPVADIAIGHRLALERGRTGECYLLGGADYDLDALVALVQRCAGTRKPTVQLPNAVVEIASAAMVAWSERVSRRPPLLTPPAVAIGRLGLRANCSKAVRDLKLPQTPLETGVLEAIAWFSEHGYTKQRRLRPFHVLRRVMKHAIGRH